MRHRAERIRRLPCSHFQRRRLLKQVVLPCFLWAPGFVLYDSMIKRFSTLWGLRSFGLFMGLCRWIHPQLLLWNWWVLVLIPFVVLSSLHFKRLFDFMSVFLNGVSMWALWLLFLGGLIWYLVLSKHWSDLASGVRMAGILCTVVTPMVGFALLKWGLTVLLFFVTGLLTTSVFQNSPPPSSRCLFAGHKKVFTSAQSLKEVYGQHWPRDFPGGILFQNRGWLLILRKRNAFVERF